MPSPWVIPLPNLRATVNGFVDTRDQLKELIEPRLNCLLCIDISQTWNMIKEGAITKLVTVGFSPNDN